MSRMKIPSDTVVVTPSGSGRVVIKLGSLGLTRARYEERGCRHNQRAADPGWDREAYEFAEPGQ